MSNGQFHDVLPLVRTMAEACDRLGLTLGVAESCTGGSLAATITELPGVSSFFLGGIVSYSNEVKKDLLGVPDRMLEEFGAVSEQVARAMAEGVRARLGTDLGVGITGVAGPGGGTIAKPVGLVFIAASTPKWTVARRDRWPGNRVNVRAASVRAALEMLIQELTPPV